jgi:hypothetical protein
MAQNSNKGIFASLFGSKKKKRTDEEIEAEQQQLRQKLEDRIREVLIIHTPNHDHA